MRNSLLLVLAYAKQTGFGGITQTPAGVVACCNHCLAQSDEPGPGVNATLAEVKLAATDLKGQYE